MIGREPPEDGILQRGVLYTFKVPRRPEREPSPDVLEIVRRGERKLIDEYLAARAKRRAS